MEIQEQNELLKKLTEIIESELHKVDPENKLNENLIAKQFRIRNSDVAVQCPTECFKLSNGKCFCFKTH